MKKIFLIRLLLVLVFSLSVFSCATEDAVKTSVNPQQYQVSSKIISLDELRTMPKVYDKLSSLINPSANAAGKKAYSEKYKFSVNTEQILMIEKGEYKSFTFPLIRDVPNKYTENLFLHPYNDGYLAFVFRYDFAKEDLDNLAKGVSIKDILSKMTFSPLDNFDIGDLNLEYQNQPQGQYATTDWNPIYLDGQCWTVNHVWEQDGQTFWDIVLCSGCSCSPPDSVGGNSGGSSSGISMGQYLAIVDLGGGGGGGSSSGGSGGGGGGSGSNSGTHPGYNIFNPPPIEGDGHNNTNPQNPGFFYNGNPIIGVLHPLFKAIDYFVSNSLDEKQNEFWHDSMSSDMKSDIQSYLEAHNYDDESKNFVIQIIDASITSGLEFDFEKSFASPANIDLTEVSGNTPQEQRFNSVYNKLMASPLFKQMFVNLFANNTKYNVKFEIGPMQNPAANAETKPFSSSSTVTNHITVKPDFLTEGSEVSIATAIIHEMIHAYLNVMRLANGVNTSVLSEQDLATCIHNYYASDLGNPTAQHDFMALNFGPVITQILTDIKDSLFTASDIDKVEHPENYDGTNTLYLPGNISATSPLSQSANSTSWNWSNFFSWQSYEGLTDSQAFLGSYPKGSEEYYFCVKYIIIGNSAFHE